MPAVMPSGVESSVLNSDTVPWDSLKPCDKDGLHHDVPSGGGVIDLDYSHCNTLASMKRSVRL